MAARYSLGALAEARAELDGVRGCSQFCRESLGRDVYAIGSGTDPGTVAAASDWGSPMEVTEVRPSHPRSYEHVCHASGVGSFLLGLHGEDELRSELMKPSLERAIGVIYRPETERASHYFAAHLPRQFDEYVWLDESHALESHEVVGLPDTHPFGL
jgi:erythromycin esterase-like protein